MKGYFLSMSDRTIYYDSREINLSKSNPSLHRQLIFLNAYTPPHDTLECMYIA